MAEEKRYYWIKLKDKFITSDAVDYLMSQKNGANYVVLYQMLCLKTINTQGTLARHIGEILIPYDTEKIQRDCKYFDIDTVRVAIELYKKLGLVYEQSNGILQIANFENLVGGESDSAERVRAYRLRETEKKALLCNGNVTTSNEICNEPCNGNVTIDKDIRYKRKIIDKDIDSIHIQPDATSSTVPNIFEKIISYLNSKTNCNYKHKTKSTQQHINARIKDGFTFDDFKTVIDKKTKEWKGTEFEKFLRPETLFGTKFESYLNTKIIIKGEVKPRDDYTHQDYTPEQLNSVYVDINNVDLDNLEI